MSRVVYAREAVEATPRKRISRPHRNAVVMDQGGRCAACGGVLAFNVDCEIDHIVPLELGGEDAPGNWQALCPPCHKLKTKADIRAIAKARRLRKKADPTTRKAPTLVGRGFEKPKFKRAWPRRPMR